MRGPERVAMPAPRIEGEAIGLRSSPRWTKSDACAAPSDRTADGSLDDPSGRRVEWGRVDDDPTAVARQSPTCRTEPGASDVRADPALRLGGQPRRSEWRLAFSESSGAVEHGVQIGLDAHQELALRRRLGTWTRAQRGVSPQDFDDLYQEAWCTLLEGERRGRRVRNREGALRWALHNSWLMENRRRRRRPAPDALDGVSLDSLVAGETADPAERVDSLETARRVCEMLVPLTARQRQILLLEVGALRPAEIQQQLGISKRTYYRDRKSALQAIAARVGSLLDAKRLESHLSTPMAA